MGSSAPVRVAVTPSQTASVAGAYNHAPYAGEPGHGIPDREAHRHRDDRHDDELELRAQRPTRNANITETRTTGCSRYVAYEPHPAFPIKQAVGRPSATQPRQAHSVHATETTP